MKYILLIVVFLSGCTDKQPNVICTNYLNETTAVSIVQLKTLRSCFKGEEIRVNGYLKLDQNNPKSYSLYDNIMALKYSDLSKQLIIELDQKQIDEFSMKEQDKAIYVSIKGVFMSPYYIKNITDIWYTDDTINLSEPF